MRRTPQKNRTSISYFLRLTGRRHLRRRFGDEVSRDMNQGMSQEGVGEPRPLGPRGSTWRASRMQDLSRVVGVSIRSRWIRAYLALPWLMGGESGTRGTIKHGSR